MKRNHPFFPSIINLFHHAPTPQTNPDFISSLAHELKTPLNALMCFSQMLQQDISKPELVADCIDYANEINQAALEMNELIHDLLDVKAINSGDFSIDLSKEIDVADVIKRSIRLNYGYALKRRIQIKSEIDESVKTARLDQKRLKQIITNIISNSVKYSPEGSLIKVCACRKNQKLEIKIIDQGFGMSEEQIKKACEKYQTFSNPNSRVVDSFGLGLSIVKNLVERQNGVIEIKSKLGAGTEVILSF